MSTININEEQKLIIHDAMKQRRSNRESLAAVNDPKERAFQKYAFDKAYHENFIATLTDKQIADYCNIVFAPEVDAKTNYYVSLLTEIDNEYSENELAKIKKEIYRYLMLEKIVYFKYKYDYMSQKNNISRLKAIQPASLKASINNEKQKGYGKVVSGKIIWK